MSQNKEPYKSHEANICEITAHIVMMWALEPARPARNAWYFGSRVATLQHVGVLLRRLHLRGISHDKRTFVLFGQANKAAEELGCKVLFDMSDPWPVQLTVGGLAYRMGGK